MILFLYGWVFFCRWLKLFQIERNPSNILITFVKFLGEKLVIYLWIIFNSYQVNYGNISDFSFCVNLSAFFLQGAETRLVTVKSRPVHDALVYVPLLRLRTHIYKYTHTRTLTLCIHTRSYNDITFVYQIWLLLLLLLCKCFNTSGSIEIIKVS